MKIKEVINVLEEWAPLAYAEGFDNVGLLVGDSQEECCGVLVTLDTLEAVVDEAIEKKMNLIVSFHPIIFSGLKKLNPKTYVERTIIKAIKNNISIYSIHTALDNHKLGVSNQLAKRLGLINNQILITKKDTLKKLTTYVPKENATELLEKLYEAGAETNGNYDHSNFKTEGQGSFRGNKDSKPNRGEILKHNKVKEVQLNLIFQKHLHQKVLQALFKNHPYEEVAFEVNSLENTNQDIGMGTIGTLENSMEENSFLELLKEKLGLSMIRHSDFLNKKISKVAVLAGSGSFAINEARQQKADAFVTADLKYHDFFRSEKQLLLVDVGHYESEQFTKNLIVDYLNEKLPNFAIDLSLTKSNPVNYK